MPQAPVDPCRIAAPSPLYFQTLERRTRASLGPAELAARGQALAAAQAANAQPIPEPVLRSLPVPSARGIPFFALTSVRVAPQGASVRVLGAGGAGAGGAGELGAAVAAARLPFAVQVGKTDPWNYSPLSANS